MPVPSTVAAPSVLLTDVTVPVFLKEEATPVYVPPVASVKLPEMFTVPEVTVQVLPVKSRLLNQLFVLIVKALAPAVTNKFGALVAEPPAVSPNRTVAVAAWFLKNPPVPVQVKFVAVPIASMKAPPTLLFKTMLPDPNAIDRVRVMDELKVPTVKLLLLSVIVPAENVKVVKQSATEPDSERLTRLVDVLTSAL
jgi:hypothetical protein